MTFTSAVFLFVFFPLCIIAYITACRTRKVKAENGVLLVASFIFYAWGGIECLIYLLIGLFINYFFGILIDNYQEKMQQKRRIFIISITVNILVLGICKYFGFFMNVVASIVKNIDSQFVSFSWHIPLPLGISFIVFQVISYLADIYNGKIRAQRNLLRFLLYFMLFPKILMGPISRYEDLANDLDNRVVTCECVYEGIVRFLRGFIKKIILANHVAVIADAVFEINGGNNFFIAWVGAIAYSLQIYIDFSSYSDMAIGLGNIFGFTLPENFNYPYAAKSIQEFWHRWHITLSSWFRDYVYIPLGGSRTEKWKVYRNNGIVFLLTGIWHGADWTFVFWGIFHGIFIIGERVKLKAILKKMPSFVGNLYTMVIVTIGWILFRADNVQNAFIFIGSLFKFRTDNLWQLSFWQNITVESVLFFIISIFICFPKMKLVEKYESILVRDIIIIVLFLIAIYYLIVENFNPFIYLRF